MKKYDVIIIGGGGAGLSAAKTAKGLRKKVLLIEKNRLGGECTWTGCVPSKGLLHQAHNGDPYNMEKIHKLQEEIYEHESPKALEDMGIDVIIGKAYFTSPHTVAVDKEVFYGKRFIIASGSRPRRRPFHSISAEDQVSNEELFHLTKKPDAVLIRGGGAVALEMAEALSLLGVRVSLLHRSGLLKNAEPEIRAQMMAHLLSVGVSIYKEDEVLDAIPLEVTYGIKLQSHVFEVDYVLAFLGREVSLEDLALDKAGIHKGDRGLLINDYLQTNKKHIYAAGDVLGHHQLSHYAGQEGTLAAFNALLPIKRKIKRQGNIRVLFTGLEVASFGLTRQELKGKKTLTFIEDFADLDRGKTDEAKGKLIVHVTKRGKILGAHIIGPRAGELIHLLAYMKKEGHRISKLGSLVVAYPTYTELLKRLARAYQLYKLYNNPLVKLFKRRSDE